MANSWLVLYCHPLSYPLLMRLRTLLGKRPTQFISVHVAQDEIDLISVTFVPNLSQLLCISGDLAFCFMGRVMRFLYCLRFTSRVLFPFSFISKE